MAKEISIQAANRFEWAAALIHTSPDEHILEIGCGTGLLAELIASSLQTGKLIAIDSSAAMIRKAEKRNQSAIVAGKLSLLTQPFNETSFKKPFNKIVAFNVNFFWKNNEDELFLIQRLMAPGGKLFVFYQTPSGLDLGLMKKIEERLTTHGFSILEALAEEKDPVRSFALIATR